MLFRSMVRTLDGTVRAFLSNRYRRIDNLDIAEIVLPVIQQMEDAYLDVYKRQVYIWLQAKLGLDARQTHIGQFSEYPELLAENVNSWFQREPLSLIHI